MARKGLLSQSLNRTLSKEDDAPEVASADTPPSPAPRQVQPRSGSPTVKRFKQTFDELRGETVQEIDTAKIGSGQFMDRFDASSEIDGLVASIQGSGQQIPILLRYAPQGSDHEYEPVYGRRRIAACRRLGIPVKAHVTELDDEALIVAQGLENSERLENSFIEKASFIVQLRDAGFEAQVIGRAIGIQNAEISRMTAVIRETPAELITAIGPAHGIGRRQWALVAKAATDLSDRKVEALIKDIRDIPVSSDRFLAALKALTEKPPAPSSDGKETVVADGQLALTRRRQRVDLKVTNKQDAEFLDWIIENGETLYEKWKAERNGS